MKLNARLLATLPIPGLVLKFTFTSSSPFGLVINMLTTDTLSHADLKNFNLLHRGKVRDVYEISDSQLILVATDRLSAFDCVSPTPIPFKGKVLTQLSAFWFRRLQEVFPNHLITENFELMPTEIHEHGELRGRSMIVKRTTVFPVECVVRGYLAGSGWKDYLENREVCGHRLPKGLVEADRLPSPIFTPATKAQKGHDENISQAELENIIGVETATKLKLVSLKLYQQAFDYAISRGIILADTKFEFGSDKNGNILWIDEALTPDSSRFWAADEYEPGRSPASFDKQFVRDYLESLDWNKKPPAPELPPEIVEATSKRYLKAFELLTEEPLKD